VRCSSLRNSILISVTAAIIIPHHHRNNPCDPHPTSHDRLNAQPFPAFSSASSFHLHIDLHPFVPPPALPSLTAMPPSTGALSAPQPSPSSQPLQYFPSQPQNRHRTSLTQSKESQAPIPRSQPDPGAGTSTKQETKDFCLIAEAAKRAQMACLMRDLGEVAL